MKRLYSKISLLAALAIAFGACQTFQLDKTDLNKLVENRQKLTQAEAFYYGEIGSSKVFGIRLMSEGLNIGFNSTFERATYYKSGYVIDLEMNFPAEVDGKTLPTGELTAAGSNAVRAANTFQTTSLNTVVNAAISVKDASKYKLTGGKVTISKSGDDYTIEIDAVNIQGVPMKAKYTGKVNVGDPWLRGEPQTKEDNTYTATSMQYAVENIPNDEQAKYASNRLTLSDDKFWTVINITDAPFDPNNPPKRPAPGVYKMGDKPAKFTFLPGSIGVPPVLNTTLAGKPKVSDKATGSYVLNVRNKNLPDFSSIRYIKDGTVTITQEGNVYKIHADVTTANGSKIVIDYKEE